MKKKIVSVLLCATMVATMFAGCEAQEIPEIPEMLKRIVHRHQVMLQYPTALMTEKSLTFTAGMKSSRAVSQITILDMRK